MLKNQNMYFNYKKIYSKMSFVQSNTIYWEERVWEWLPLYVLSTARYDRFNNSNEINNLLGY